MESTRVETTLSYRDLMEVPSWDIVSQGVKRRSIERYLRECIAEAGCIPAGMYYHDDLMALGYVIGMKGLPEGIE